MISKFDIWLAEVRYKDIEGSKKRPVLILDHIKKEVFCLKMTSQTPKTADDFEIIHWQEAGLQKPTIINTAIRLRLEEDKLIFHIGTLHNDNQILLKIRHQIL
jgi:mRNA interferase MazF